MNKSLAALSVLAATLSPPAVAQDISARSGDYTIEDGMTIVLSGTRVVLRHISAPPLGTMCQLKGRPRDCGLISRSSLLDLSAGAAIICKKVEQGMGRCTSGGFDLAENLVYTGWAVPVQGAPAKYWRQMDGAMTRKRGFWNATFTPAWPPQQAALNR